MHLRVLLQPPVRSCVPLELPLRSRVLLQLPVRVRALLPNVFAAAAGVRV